MMSRVNSILLLFLLVPPTYCQEICSVLGKQLNSQDPNLRELTYDLGHGEDKILAYVPAHVSSFYQIGAPFTAKQVVRPRHEGLGAKFINLSKNPVHVFWERKEFDFDSGNGIVIRHVPAFSAKGTSSFPGHSFVFASEDGVFLKRVVVDPSSGGLHSFDPYHVENDKVTTQSNLARELSQGEQNLYWKWRNTLAFDAHYRKFTGRTYLAMFPRKPPVHFMWPAKYFQQEHWITTRETHFLTVPPQVLETKVELRKRGVNEPVALTEYRSDQPFLNLSLTVVSCEPRVFEINDFLSSSEVQHILDLAEMMSLAESTSGDEKIRSDSTRTSRNTWVHRSQTAVIDAIYRRAADLMRIDEALMRPRAQGEEVDFPYDRPLRNHSIAEQLQLVHYAPGQEYQAHHDFAYAPLSDEDDPARFATLLLYLNEDMAGGETSFPKFSNAHTFLELKVKPKVGKGVLFYSQLPDGNMDELSQHRAHPVRIGNKWLINLWVWDPVSSAES